MGRFRSLTWGVVIVCCLCGLASYARAGGSPPTRKATFLPHWLPQAQFAGYYVAFEKGFYRNHGIDLTVLRGGPDRPASEALAARQTDFATMWLSTAIQMRSHGVPIVELAQVVQRSALMLVAMKSSGIRTAHDLDGAKVGTWGGDFLLQPDAFFKQQGVAVHLVPLGSSCNLFLRGGVNAMTAMWYNEYHTILSSGLEPSELVAFFFHDYGLNFPEDGIYCREEMLTAEPGLCRSFAAASLEGWQWSFAHPEEALDVVLRYMAAAQVPANRVHQRWMLARMKDVIAPAGLDGAVGRLRREDYERVGAVLLDRKLVTAVPDFAAFYRPGPP